jgi:hypothetical protein
MRRAAPERCAVAADLDCSQRVIASCAWCDSGDALFLFDADVHEATVVTLFLLNSVNEKLRPKLLKDSKPGTRVVSNTFGMGDWKPDKEVSVGDPVEGFSLSQKLFLWTIPQRNDK